MIRSGVGRAGDRRPLRELALTLGAVVGVVCLLAAAGALVLGLKPLIFRSGSMAPAIDTGALAVARTVPASEIRVGDVISVTDGGGRRITHRVQQIMPGDPPMMILKGDANASADSVPYAVPRADRVIAHVAGLGYLVSWLGQPAVVFAGGVLVGVLLVVAFGRPRPTAEQARRAVTTTTVVVVLGATLAGLSGLALRTGRPAALGIPTDAAFVDAAGAASGSFGTATRIASPSLTCSGLGVAAVRFTWTAVSGATGYDLVLTGASGGTYPQAATTAVTLNGVLGSGTAVVRAKIAYAETTWFSADSAPRSYTFAVVSLCG